MSVSRVAQPLSTGVTLSCRVAGPPGAPLVVFLHGFPEAAFVWDGLLERFADRFRCVAPNLRGYEDSSAPPEIEAYRAKHLVADLRALIEANGGPARAVVAHDWGGAVAWSFAARHPALLDALVIVNSPHPATFLRELLTNPAQQRASAYMNFLSRPDAERLLAENDFARLWPFFANMGGAAWLTETVRDRYRDVWSKGLSGGCNFYRASPLKPPTGPDSPIHAVVFPPEAVTVRVPTRVVWGERDIALPVALLDRLEAYVPDLSIARVADASHWIVHEAPDRVAAEIERALAG